VLKEVSHGGGSARTGATAFASTLLENCSIGQPDLSIAEHYADREQTTLADAVVALGFVDERDSYAALAQVTGLEIIDLHELESSELAIRLVPERLARRHAVVPVSVDNQLLTFATCRPMNPEAERDIAVASGRRTRIVLAARSAVLAALDRCYPKMRELDVLAGASDLQVAWGAEGVPSTREQALRLVEAGTTTIEEVNRVLSAEGTGAATKPNAKQRVLVTDDEPITRMVVKLLLEKHQYKILEATNGRDAVEIATRERPDLLVIDLNMPEMDGYEAIARLRRDMSLAMMPILVLTGEEGPVERLLLQLGADDYLVKPFNPEVLVSRVNAVFRRLEVVAA
jgi:CheY-like chemotaxis protein